MIRGTSQELMLLRGISQDIVFGDSPKQKQRRGASSRRGTLVQASLAHHVQRVQAVGDVCKTFRRPLALACGLILATVAAAFVYRAGGSSGENTRHTHTLETHHTHYARESKTVQLRPKSDVSSADPIPQLQRVRATKETAGVASVATDTAPESTDPEVMRPVCEVNTTLASVSQRRSVRDAYELMKIHHLLLHNAFIASHSTRLRPLARSTKSAGRSIVRSVLTSLAAAVAPTLPLSEAPSLTETNTLLGTYGQLPLSRMPDLSPMPDYIVNDC